MADVKAVFQKMFPYISAAASLGGPIGTMAANAIGQAIGAKVDPNAAAINTALVNATPDQIIQMKKVEADLQIKLKELGFQDAEEMAKLAAADRDSARQREIAVKDWTPRLLAWLVVVGVVVVEGRMLFGDGIHVDPIVLGRILGTLDSALMLVLSYYFGSSAGSDRKTELLAGATTVPNEAQKDGGK